MNRTLGLLVLAATVTPVQQSPGSVASPRVADLPPASVAMAEPSAGTDLRGALGEQVTVHESFDCFPDGQPVDMLLGCPQWSSPQIVSSNFMRATTAPSRAVVATSAGVPSGGPDANGVWNVGGRKIRLGSSEPVTAGQFLFGFRYEFRLGVQDFRTALDPAPGAPARLEHDVFVDSADTLWTSEARSRDTGWIGARALWGGTCAQNDCDVIGLPFGPIEHLYVLGSDGFAFRFFQAIWVESAPAGANIGDQVVMPVGSWVRIRHESAMEPYRSRLYIDIHDGAGMRLVSDQPMPTYPGFSGLDANGSYESDGGMWVDNLFGSGVFNAPLFNPPPALECGPTGFLDDLQWMDGLSNSDGAGNVWSTSERVSIANSGGDISLRYTTPFVGDAIHRSEMSRWLPTAYPIEGEPWRMCVETRLGVGSTGARAIAIGNFVDDSLTARVSQGVFDPLGAPPYIGRILVQHNPDYDPIDDEDTINPFEPGPGGNGGTPVVGGAATIGQPGFDYYDTGVTLTMNADRALCVGVRPDGELEGSYGGVDFVGGSTGVAVQAFAASIDHVRFEAEPGPGNSTSWFIDDVGLDCIGLPLAELPALSMPYHDDLNWGVEGVTIRAFDDDGLPATPFRWTSAPRTPFVVSGAGLALSSENVLADTVQSPAGPTVIVKAATLLPGEGGEATSGYAAGADVRLTDFLTSRGWAIEGAGGVHAALFFSGATGTFWSFGADGDAMGGGIWTDTGVTPAQVGLVANSWCSVRIVRQPDAHFTFRIQGAALLDDQGELVRVASASGSTEPGRLLFLGGDDRGAPAGSTLVLDNVRAWGLPCAGDVSDNGEVTFADLNAILGAFGENVGTYDPRDIAPDADGDGFGDDGVVNFADLNAALGGFNNPCD